MELLRQSLILNARIVSRLPRRAEGVTLSRRLRDVHAEKIVAKANMAYCESAVLRRITDTCLATFIAPDGNHHNNRLYGKTTVIQNPPTQFTLFNRDEDILRAAMLGKADFARRPTTELARKLCRQQKPASCSTGKSYAPVLSVTVFHRRVSDSKLTATAANGCVALLLKR